jgi:hypothetical protein
VKLKSESERKSEKKENAKVKSERKRKNKIKNKRKNKGETGTAIHRCAFPAQRFTAPAARARVTTQLRKVFRDACQAPVYVAQASACGVWCRR